MFSLITQFYLKIFLLSILLAGCAKENNNSEDGKSDGNSSQGMTTPNIGGSSYSVTLGSITSQAGAVVGSYVASKCKSSVSGSLQGATNWSWNYDGTNPLIALALNDTVCQLNISSFKITGAGAGNYVNSGGAMLASNGSYGSITKFCMGTCSTTTEVYAKARIIWSNGAATIYIAYASDPTSLAATGKGTFAVQTSVPSPNLILNPNYTSITYSPGAVSGGFVPDNQGYVQPVGASSITGSVSISIASQVANYYGIFTSAGISTLTSDVLSSPVGKQSTFEYYFDNNMSNFVGAGTTAYFPSGGATISIPLYASNPSSTWGLLQYLTYPNTQPCGYWPTSCTWTDYTAPASFSYKGFGTYNPPTVIPSGGLVYYVVLVNKDAASAQSSFTVVTLTITQ